MPRAFDVQALAHGHPRGWIPAVGMNRSPATAHARGYPTRTVVVVGVGRRAYPDSASAIVSSRWAPWIEEVRIDSVTFGTRRLVDQLTVFVPVGDEDPPSGPETSLG